MHVSGPVASPRSLREASRTITGTRSNLPVPLASRIGFSGSSACLEIHGFDEGDEDQYGHWDLLIVCRTEHEIQPWIAAYLEEA